MKRGIFFSIDAVLALLISSVLIAATLQSISQIESIKAGDNAHALSSDALSLMEKNGLLADAVKSNSQQKISNYLQMLPKNICYRFSIIKPPEKDPIMASENCECAENSIASRSFVVPLASAGKYVAEMRSCIR